MQVSPQIETRNKLSLSTTKVLVIIGLIIIVIAVPLTVFLAKTRQEPRSKASEPAPTLAKTFKLTLTSPTDNLATNQNVITISGSVNKKAIILISGGLQEEAIETTNQFSQNYELTAGDNQIEVTAFDEEGNEATQVKNILYVKESLD